MAGIHYPGNRTMSFRICKDTLTLCAICMLDTLLTMFLVSRGLAQEANPLMAACIAHSLLLFCLVKLLPMIPLVALVESYRRHNPSFVGTAIRCTSIIYVGMYLILVAAANTRC